MIPKTSSSVRVSLLAALLSASAVCVSLPARAESIAPERALLNRTEAREAVVSPDRHASPWKASEQLSGEEALLNRRPSPADRPAASTPVRFSAASRDGAQVLLNRPL